MTQNTINVAGIDTGKTKLDIVLSPGGQELQVDNTPDGHIVLSDWLNEHRVTHAGIEASGGYEAAIVAHLRARDCHDFRVWAGIMGKKESPYVPTQRTRYT